MRGATRNQPKDQDLYQQFQSTLLMRGATSAQHWADSAGVFQSTLLMRGATLRPDRAGHATHISIHAPHARSDSLKLLQTVYGTIFQSTLLMRGATRRAGQAADNLRFQSTLLMRGATKQSSAAAVLLEFQSTLLMRGATRALAELEKVKEFQSTLLMRGATDEAGLRQPDKGFQSTLLMRGATPTPSHALIILLISIHAPHARSDWNARRDIVGDNISIHAPHARSDLTASRKTNLFAIFQSTLLMRGATFLKL